ncbi:hypothetical protein A4G99_21160 [Haladaptatus sp. R4]|nr:hypothetical protein A4G99_21160 [Haladaptatus sp. R4]
MSGTITIQHNGTIIENKSFDLKGSKETDFDDFFPTSDKANGTYTVSTQLASGAKDSQTFRDLSTIKMIGVNIQDNQSVHVVSSVY